MGLPSRVSFTLAPLALFSVLIFSLSVLPADAEPVGPFPSNSDEVAKANAQRAINQALQGGGPNGNHVMSGYSGGRFRKHPWLPVRNAGASEMDWRKDSQIAIGGGMTGIFNFLECFEPRLILDEPPNIPGTCSFYCNPPVIRPTYCKEKINTGFMFAYWWPEAEVEVNNFGVAALNPLTNGRQDLVHDMLAARLEALLAAKESQGGANPDMEHPVDWELRAHGAQDGNFTRWPGGLRVNPNLGQTQVEGQLPGDQDLNLEAHVYQTKVGKDTSDKRKPYKGSMGWVWKRVKFGCIPKPFWYNGYKKGNKECFYNTLRDKSPTIHAWSEEPTFAPYWRIAEFSQLLDSNLYRASAPLTTMGRPVGLISDGMQFSGSFVQTKSCASYRAKRWESRYADLQYAVEITPMEIQSGERLCYKGGGDLFPITGTISSSFSPGTAAAYLTLRALFMSGRKGNNQTNLYSDKADKIQRVEPQPTKCLRVNDIDDLNRSLFPGNLIKPGDDQKTSIRYVYWNMRIACVCQYRGTYPIPFPPGPGAYFYPQGQGCHPYEYRSESKGDKDNQDVRGINLSGIAAMCTFAEAATQLYPFGFGVGVGNICSMEGMSGLANMASITSAVNSLGTMTNALQSLGSTIGALGNLGGLMGQITQVSALTQTLGGMQNLTGVANNLSGLTSNLGNVSSILSQTGGLAGMGQQIQSIMGGNGLTSLTQLGSGMNTLTGVAGNLTSAQGGLSQILGSGGALNVSQLGQIQGIVSNLNGSLGSLNGLNLQQISSGLNGVQGLGGIMTNLQGVTGGLNGLQTAAGSIGNLGGLTSNLGNLQGIAGNLGNLSQMGTQISALGNLNTTLSTLTTQINVTQLSGQLSQIQNMAQMGNLNATQIAGLTSQLSSIQGQLNVAQGLSGQLGGLESQLNNLSGIQNQLGQLATLQTQLGGLSSISGIVSNQGVIQGQITGIVGNLNGAGALQGQLQQLAGSLPTGNLASQLSNVTSQFGNLGSLQNTLSGIQSQLGSMGNNPQAISLSAQISTLQNNLSGLSGVNAQLNVIQGQVSNLPDASTVTNVASQLSNLGGLQTTLNGVGSQISTLGQAQSSLQPLQEVGTTLNNMGSVSQISTQLNNLDNIRDQINQLQVQVTQIPDLQNQLNQIQLNLNASLTRSKSSAGNRELSSEGRALVDTLIASQKGDPEAEAQLERAVHEISRMQGASGLPGMGRLPNVPGIESAELLRGIPGIGDTGPQ